MNLNAADSGGLPVDRRHSSDTDVSGVRPARQRRTREMWVRVLDAGLQLLEESGYDGFTIAAVCDRAGVAPPQLYARVDSKDALFLAVYEHGMARQTAAQEAITVDASWAGATPHEVVDGAVRAMAGVFAAGDAFLRAVILVAGVHPELNRRGSRYSREFLDRFIGLVLRHAGAAIVVKDPELAVRAAMNSIWSAMVFRTAYGPGFATEPMDDDVFLETQSEMVRGYLFRS